MTIIGLMGKARHGKDTVGLIIKDLIPRSETVGLAEPIKAICRVLFDFSDEQMYGSLKEVPDERYPRDCAHCGGRGWSGPKHGGALCPHCNGSGRVFLTPRWAMQYIGTEVARALYADVWVDLGIRRARDLLAGNVVKVSRDGYDRGDPAVDEHDVVAFTDVRFLNEAKTITSNGGQVWRIVRPELENNLSDQSKAHASEMELESPEMEQYVTRTILNDGTIEDLKDKVGANLLQQFSHELNISQELYRDE